MSHITIQLLIFKWESLGSKTYLPQRTMTSSNIGYSHFQRTRAGAMDISAVNALTYEAFVELFGNVVEKCPIISAAIWSHRPFKDLTDIEAHITEFIHSLSDSGKLGYFFLLYQLNNTWYHVS